MTRSNICNPSALELGGIVENTDLLARLKRGQTKVGAAMNRVSLLS